MVGWCSKPGDFFTTMPFIGVKDGGMVVSDGVFIIGVKDGGMVVDGGFIIGVP